MLGGLLNCGPRSLAVRNCGPCIGVPDREWSGYVWRSGVAVQSGCSEPFLWGRMLRSQIASACVPQFRKAQL
eukprot:13198313-Alexandrium_andersonii.AAC.1